MHHDAPYRIVVFTSDLNYSVRRGIGEIDSSGNSIDWLVVLHTPSHSLAEQLRNQTKLLKRNGWRWVYFRVLGLWHSLAERLFNGRTSPLFNEHPLTRLEECKNIRCLQVHNVNSQDTIGLVTSFNPDLGISLGAPILRPSLFSIPKNGSINLHKGKLPDYRGMPPAFWELWNDEKSVGCTVHAVEKSLDSGQIIVESAINRGKYSTLQGLQMQLDELGIDLMRKAVDVIIGGHITLKPQDSAGTTYRKPTLSQISELTRKLKRLQPTRTPVVKTLLKNSVFRVAWNVSPLASPLRSRRVVVLLYHRVTDDVRNTLSVGIEQFDQQMSLLSRYCRPLSIQELVNNKGISQCTEPQVCVTFDDGYLDNYVNAVPILLKHNIPAAFFVSTGLIGTTLPFPHDLRQGHTSIPNMEWEHLQSMHESGFTIGSHTVNHIDCAKEEESVVRHELEHSRSTLEEILGVDDLIFAYPYGGKQHMTEDRREIVKQAGYRACLSAYGGVNLETTDPYNICRRGIHWEFSDDAFLFQCLGM